MILQRGESSAPDFKNLLSSIRNLKTFYKGDRSSNILRQNVHRVEEKNSSLPGCKSLLFCLEHVFIVPTFPLLTAAQQDKNSNLYCHCFQTSGTTTTYMLTQCLEHDDDDCWCQTHLLVKKTSQEWFCCSLSSSLPPDLRHYNYMLTCAQSSRS